MIANWSNSLQDEEQRMEGRVETSLEAIKSLFVGVQILISDVSIVVWSSLFDLSSCADMKLCAQEEREEIRKEGKGRMREVRRKSEPYFKYSLHSEN